VIREVPFCPYLDSPPDFSFGENGENCLDGAITVTGHVCVNSNLFTGKMKEEIRKKSTFHGAGVI